VGRVGVPAPAQGALAVSAVFVTHLVQGIAGLMWLAVAALFFTRVRLAARVRAPTPLNFAIGALFFNGLVQVCFTLRWVIFPHAIETMPWVEIVAWGGLYATSILDACLALCVEYLLRENK
jgi:phosphatidylserine synthase